MHQHTCPICDATWDCNDKTGAVRVMNCIYDGIICTACYEDVRIEKA